MTRTATARQPKVAKVAYKPYVTKESPTTYTVQSERFVHILYTVTVAVDGSVSCDCPAHEYGRTCKHASIVAKVVAYNAHPSHLRPMVEEAAPVLVAPIELAARRKVAPAFIPAPSDLMECFS